MSQSLSRLVNNLETIPITMKELSCEAESVVKLLKRKGIYSYEYMDSFKRFNEENLPEKKDFYSSVTDEHISDEDYNHAKTMWDLFNCKNLGDYHDLYLKMDVLLLADIFENFRKTCINYELDPAHYFSTPGLSWDAMLKMTGIKLDLMTDVDKLLMIEKGMTGGISYIGHRHAKANNKDLSDYDSSKPSNYIIHLDANNLYG